MIFDFLFNDARTKKEKKKKKKKYKQKEENKEEKKKLEEKPIYCSNYLALMLHKTT